MILPFSYNLYFDIEEEYIARIKIGWAFGLISLELNLGKGYDSWLRVVGIKAHKINLHVDKKKDVQEKEIIEELIEEPKETNKKNIFTFEYIRELIRMGIVEDLFEFLEKFLRIVLLKKIEIAVHYGTFDPSLTGHIHGVYSCIPVLRKKWNIYLYPNFVEEEFRIEGFVFGRFQIISITIITIKLLFNKTVRKILRDMRRNRRNGKQKSS